MILHGLVIGLHFLTYNYTTCTQRSQLGAKPKSGATVARQRDKRRRLDRTSNQSDDACENAISIRNVCARGDTS